MGYEADSQEEKIEQESKLRETIKMLVRDKW